MCGARSPRIYDLIDKPVWNARDLTSLRDFVKKLHAMNAYLTALAEATDKDILDPEVVNAYLIGWNGWKDFEVAAPLKRELKKISIPSQFEKIDNMPEDLPFTHNFHVLYFGAVAKDIPDIEKMADHCKVSLGEFSEGGAVKYNRLVEGHRLMSGDLTLKASSLPVSKGDKIFIHYRTPFKLATPQEVGLYQDNFNRILAWFTSS
ncbi:MAG TPA: hypothetical protein ENN60_03760 [archaeon]|nr:hypothetical protein [archaeon]